MLQKKIVTCNLNLKIGEISMYINYPISFISMNDTDKDVTLLHNKLIPTHTNTPTHLKNTQSVHLVIVCFSVVFSQHVCKSMWLLVGSFVLDTLDTKMDTHCPFFTSHRCVML